MAKYTFEFKKKIVLEYLQGKGGSQYLAKKHGIPSSQNIMTWVNNYKAFGDEGLFRSRQQKQYSFEKKLFVVQLYLTGEMSYSELAIQEGITNPSMIVDWVKRFRVAGVDALRPRRKGRKKSMNKPGEKPSRKPAPKNLKEGNEKQLMDLQQENLELRLENALLKEMRRLRLVDEAKTREWRSSYTVSEDHSG